VNFLSATFEVEVHPVARMIVDHQRLNRAIALDEQWRLGHVPVSGYWHTFRYTVGGHLASQRGPPWAHGGAQRARDLIGAGRADAERLGMARNPNVSCRSPRNANTATSRPRSSTTLCL